MHYLHYTLAQKLGRIQYVPSFDSPREDHVKLWYVAMSEILKLYMWIMFLLYIVSFYHFRSQEGTIII